MLGPDRLDISQEFVRGFEGMTDMAVTLDDLLQAREEFIEKVIGNMPYEHRRFLLSCKKSKPEWDLLGIPHAEKLPAAQWRLQNLAKVDAKKREKLLNDLLTALAIEG